MTTFWLIVCIATAIAEIMTLAMISIWFTAGAFVAMVCAFFGAPEMLQIVVFAAVSVITLALFKVKGQKITGRLNTPTNADRVIGREGLVLKAVDALRDEGLVRVDGQEWSARPVDESRPIPEGETVIVRRIQGVKLLVEPKADNEA